MASMSAVERALHFFVRPLVRCVYRVTTQGIQNLPKGRFLLLPNHITWVDAIMLQLACPRPIRYIIDQEFYRKPILHPFLRAVRCIPIDTRHPRSAIRAAAEQIAAGEIVCLFPEGQLTRSGTLLRLRRGYQLITHHAPAPVVPAWLDQLWGSIFSFQGGRFFTKLPRKIPYRVTVAFGKPLDYETADMATVREELLKLGESCYSRRPSLDRHLGQACVRARLRVAISANEFAKRLKDFPWPTRVLHLDEVLPPMKRQILSWWMMSIFVPSPVFVRLLQLPRKGNHGEATLLFTSGSSGEPKGVVLTHRNIVGNVSQCSVLLDARKEDSILASLPFFHTFGFTVTLWYPLIEGVRIVTYPNALDPVKNAELIEKYQVTLLLATPTFLRGYLRKAKAEQFRSLRLVITGAEKLPLDLSRRFEECLKQRVFEGYGLTETSPVASVNLAEPQPTKPGETVQPSSRLGSTGKMAPGIAAEIREPESDRKLSLHQTGMLWLRGPNIFEGYLHDPQRTAEALRHGWFKTGDIGRFDEDGFLYIEGRLSRFSKIGGEMVPHETMEHKIAAALDLHGESERKIAIVGVMDESKGEALVLLSAVDVDLAQLRKKLHEAGVPNLWIPKRVQCVESIPVLASGKLDLTKCKELVMRNSSTGPAVS